MTHRLRQICFAATLSALGLSTLCVSANRAQAAATPAVCFEAWTDAAPVVQREALAAVRDIHAGMRQRNAGDVVRVQLCTEDNRYVYRLIVREPKGRIVPLTVDARHPFSP